MDCIPGMLKHSMLSYSMLVNLIFGVKSSWTGRALVKRFCVRVHHVGNKHGGRGRNKYDGGLSSSARFLNKILYMRWVRLKRRCRVMRTQQACVHQGFSIMVAGSGDMIPNTENNVNV